MDTKAKVREIYDQVRELESNQEMLERLAAIVVPKLNGEELLEISWICCWLDLFLRDQVFFADGASHNGKDIFLFGHAFGAAEEKVYPTVATLNEMNEANIDPETGGWCNDDLSQDDLDAMFLQAVDHDRSHPGARSIAGKC
jgi:hypothetical protein